MYSKMRCHFFGCVGETTRIDPCLSHGVCCHSGRFWAFLWAIEIGDIGQHISLRPIEPQMKRFILCIHHPMFINPVVTHTRINLYGSSTCCTCTCYCFIPSDAPTLCGQVILKFSKEARLHVLVDLLNYILVTPSPSCLIQTCDAFIFSPLSKVAGVAMAKGQGVMVKSHPRRILPVHFRVDLSLRQVLIYSLNVA